jgi:iron-sulfur cluster assembly protein
LAMALDEPKDNDTVYDVENFKYIVDKDFMDKAKPITVDFMGMGFKITSGLDLGAPGGCSGCGSDSSCG